MVATTPLYPTRQVSEDEEPRIVLRGVSWAAYVSLRDAIESASVRMTYLEGVLEITSPSRAHEVEKKQIARFIELFCLERDIPLYGYGSMTMRKEEGRRGLEADECYRRDADGDVTDFAIEVIKTRGTLDKLEVYRGVGVREVWVFEDGRVQVLARRDAGYARAARSDVLPELDLDVIATFVLRTDQHAALRAFRDLLRAG